jgi:hypothetical protein
VAATVVGAHLRFPPPRQDVATVATTASTGDAAAVVLVEHEAGGGGEGHALGTGAARGGGVRAKRARKAGGSKKRAAGQFLFLPQYPQFPQEQPLPFLPGACDTGYVEYEAPFPKPDGAILAGHKVDEYLASYACNKGHSLQQGVPCVLQALQQEQQLQLQQQVCLCVCARARERESV